MQLRRYYTDDKGRRVDEWATSQLVLVTREDGTLGGACEWSRVPDLARAAEQGLVPEQEPTEDLADLVAMLDADARERGGRARLCWLGDSPAVIGGDDPAPIASPADRIRERVQRKAASK